MKTYNQLQKTFDRVEFLIHFNKKRTFYININVFKQRELEIIICYLKHEIDTKNSKRFNIEFILFLNKILNIINSYY